MALGDAILPLVLRQRGGDPSFKQNLELREDRVVVARSRICLLVHGSQLVTEIFCEACHAFEETRVIGGIQSDLLGQGLKRLLR